MYRTRRPAPPLDRFVHLVWLYEGYPATHARERLMPDGSSELVINLKQDEIRLYDTDCRRFPGAVLIGARSESFVIDTEEQARVIGVHFRAGGVFPFLRMPADELHNRHIALEDLWGREVRELRHAIIEASTPEARLDRLEAELRLRLVRPEPHPAIGFALREFNTVPHLRTVADVTGQIGLSLRRFIQIFREHVGLTPKMFCRVRRFQETIRTTARAHQVDWARVANDCGYYDQAHFIHDFRDFSGFSPGAYLARRGDHLNHIPL